MAWHGRPRCGCWRCFQAGAAEPVDTLAELAHKHGRLSRQTAHAEAGVALQVASARRRQGNSNQEVVTQQQSGSCN